MKEKDDDCENTSPNVIEMTTCNDKAYNNPEDTKISMKPIVFNPNQKGIDLCFPSTHRWIFMGISEHGDSGAAFC